MYINVFIYTQNINKQLNTEEKIVAIPKLPSKLIQARIIKRSVQETRLDKSISSIFLLSLPIAHLSHEDVIDSQVYVCSDVSDEEIIIIIMRRINVKDLHLQLCYDKVSYFACRRQTYKPSLVQLKPGLETCQKTLAFYVKL